MGKEKYIRDVEDLFSKSPVIGASSIDRLIKSRKNVKQYSKQLIRNFVLKGKIKRLAKGCYTMHDDISLAVFCFKPSYLGLQDALSFHELWEQETVPVIITSRRVRQGIRKILGTNVLIRRIDKKYMFGFEYLKYGEFYLPYSDIEKTLIDLIYFKQNISKDVKKNIIKNINMGRLKAYLKAYPKAFRKKFFSYIKSQK